MDSPNPITAAFSILRAQRVSRPRPAGAAPAPDHGLLAAVLDAVRMGGVGALPGMLDVLDAFAASLTEVRPDDLAADDALAFWLNLYNAGALTLAGEAAATAEGSVLRLPGAFTRSMFTVAGELLSLDDVEHGKIRRFGDPRIHGALVCGSASCPTLRYEPFGGDGIDDQLEDQMRHFLLSGGAVVDRETLLLSRIFLWYGNDFVRPGRMPNFLPTTRRRIGAALVRWLPDDIRRWYTAGSRTVAFQDYDWSLACSVGRPA